MKKLEPGMLCRVVGSRRQENSGKVVKLVKFSGRLKDQRIGRLVVQTERDDWWETDTILAHTDPRIPADTLMSSDKLEPINPDHQPADEEFQELFNNMLSGNKQTVKSGG